MKAQLRIKEQFPLKEKIIGNVLELSDGTFVARGPHFLYSMDKEFNPLLRFMGYAGVVSRILLLKFEDRVIRCEEEESGSTNVSGKTTDEDAKTGHAMTMATISNGETIQLWNHKQNKPLFEIESENRSIFLDIFQLKNGHLVSFSNDKTVRVWDLSKNNLGCCLGWVKTEFADAQIFEETDDGKIQLYTNMRSYNVCSIDMNTLLSWSGENGEEATSSKPIPSYHSLLKNETLKGRIEFGWIRHRKLLQSGEVIYNLIDSSFFLHDEKNKKIVDFEKQENEWISLSNEIGDGLIAAVSYIPYSKTKSEIEANPLDGMREVPLTRFIIELKPLKPLGERREAPITRPKISYSNADLCRLRREERSRSFTSIWNTKGKRLFSALNNTSGFPVEPSCILRLRDSRLALFDSSSGLVLLCELTLEETK